MKKIIVLFLLPFTSLAQFTPYGIGLVQQPNPPAAQIYLQVTNLEAGTNVVFSPGSRGGRAKINVPSGAGSGTVTKFSSGAFSPLFTTSVANPTTTPALSFAAVNQNANLIFSGPSAGVPAAPTFRSLVANDIPTLTLSKISDAGTVAAINLDGNGAHFLNGLGTWTTPSGGSGTVTTFSAGALSPLFTTSVATPTTTPALSFALDSVSANQFFGGPASGGASTPTYRALIPSDLGAFTNHSDVVPLSLAPGQILAWSGSAWTNGQPGSGSSTLTVTNAGNATGSLINDSNQPAFKFKSLSAGANVTLTDQGTNIDIASTGGGTSLPGILIREVQAAADGTLSAPTWPDDNVYKFDEEFDSFIGTGNGQFSKNNFTPVSVTTGGGVLNVASNYPGYYGVIQLQSPTAASNTLWTVSYGSTGIMPYYGLANSSNWLFHAVFFLATSNTGSIFRIGLVDQTYNGSVGAGLFPSNFVGLRWSVNSADGNHFAFNARSNATDKGVASSIVVATNTPYKFTMFSTNAGVVLFSINGESWQKLTNTPVQGMCIAMSSGTTNGVANRLDVDRVSFMQVVGR